jgi:hypothetical protein
MISFQGGRVEASFEAAALALGLGAALALGAAAFLVVVAFSFFAAVLLLVEAGGVALVSRVATGGTSTMADIVNVE